MQTISQLIEQKKLLVCIGSGGVGKTTFSILLALHAYSLGKRVALISIDPARRLASALGIKLTGELHPILEGYAAGTLHASMLDQKEIFDRVVRRFTKSTERQGSIFANPFYKAASEFVAGPMEYMALAKVNEALQSNLYDLVVLDTPPATNALDFINKPQLLAEFVNKKIINLLIKPFQLLAKTNMQASLGKSKILKHLVDFAGLQALGRLFEFILLSEDMILGLHEVGEKMHTYLQGSQSAFILVTAPTRLSTREALFLANDGLGSAKLQPAAVIFNRCLDPRLVLELGPANHLDTDTFAKLQGRQQSEGQAIEAMLKGLARNSGSMPASILVQELLNDLQDKAQIWQIAVNLSEHMTPLAAPV